MIEQFCAAQLQRGVMASSVQRRAADLRKFDRWLDPGTLLDATVADVEAFLVARGWAEPTRYAFLSHLHAYYKWAVRRKLVDFDPTEFVDRPRLRPGLPRPIADDALAYLLSQSTGRMRAWLVLGSFGGLRCMEIAGLHRSDIVDSDGYMRVLGKGGKERIVPLHPLVLEALRVLPMPRLGPLWTAQSGQPLTGANVSQLANRWIREMGVDATMHQLRHWFGTRSYRSCQDVLAVAGLMGHSNAATTAVYAKFSHKVAIAAVLSLSVGDPQLPGQ